MLSDEEKKAIEYWKTHMEILHWNTQLASEHYIKVLLDLVEKQSKDIEDLKEDRDKFKKALGKRITYCNELEKDLFENCSNYVVSKDKIKAKIEEVSNGTYDAKIVLQSLLEKE